MAREHWRDRETQRRSAARDDFGQADYSDDYAYDPRSRTGYRAADAEVARDDYGQADYTTDWAYDRERGRPYRRFSEDDRGEAPRQGRSWMDRAGELFGARPHDHYEDDRRLAERDAAQRRRRGPSDRVLWAVIMERLDEARVDLRDVDVKVSDGEVILDGVVRRRADKRRIEDLVDVDGVRNVQNNLKPRDMDHRWRLL
jgi:hypothetical protein